MVSKAATLAGTAACLLGMAWYLPRRIKRSAAKRQREKLLECKSSCRRASWSSDAPVDRELMQLVLERFFIQREMIESRVWQYYLVDSRAQADDPNAESVVAEASFQGHRIMEAY
ncbi:hypothetical protein JKP88DRAFT_246168 [Tribonema minus]|uniref:Uncharacterized protein n=1 Tax=Tribonema minus TaxID=303371 RepID=A0A835YY66_9STRA|nr:hypothetical protein JKP88DRAFT_246168 [Tribonema minus]